jgi:hypothetical protein
VIQLLGEDPHRLEPRKTRQALDKAQKCRGINRPKWSSLSERTKGVQHPLLLGVIRDEQEWLRPASTPTAPLAPQRWLISDGSARDLDAVDETALGDPITPGGNPPRVPHRADRVQELARIHRRGPPTTATTRG